MVHIRMPNITGRTEKEQLQQIRQYLCSLVQELNFALAALEENK